ncbi:MAG: acyl-CoA thioesterase [Aureispira sp.]|nr:acyl-CoA thioesterase [Aureispira sp.]
MARKSKKISESRTVMTEIIMPNDTNPINNLMGGNLMRWMDIVSAICAGKHCEHHVVTVSVDNVSFDKPVPVGDVITLQAVVTRAFSTSVEIFVEVFAANMQGGNSRRCNDAYFTFVAVDDSKKRPQAIPAVLPLTAEELKRYDEALQRRQLSLLLAKKLPPEKAQKIKAELIQNL